MKVYISAFMTLVPLCAISKQDSAVLRLPPAPYGQGAVTGTLSLGVFNQYRNRFSYPANFKRQNVTGFLPWYAMAEYAAGQYISVAATAGLDNYTVNYNQLYDNPNSGQTIGRYKNNNVRVLSGGVAVFCHFHELLHTRRLDPFAGIGISLNNIRESGYPGGDSVAARTTHTVTPYLKVGARYYLTETFSFFGDAGYSKSSVVSLGISCRVGVKPRYIVVPDADKDGVADSRDSCMYEAGLKLLNGCPDSDNDGIADSKDRCPAEAGPAHLLGCPERKVKIETPVDSTMTTVAPEQAPEPEHIVLKVNSVQFATGRTGLTAESYAVLDSAIKLLQRDMRPVVEVDGYADTTGTVLINKRISAERAAIVRRYLVQHGIAPERITARGHGSTGAVASNRTRAGRAKNRRATLSIKYR
ncbi:MAG: OmpA family protein [Bacteroidota bacterium]